MFHKDSVYLPEILKCIIDESKAELLISLPGTVMQLAQKTGRDQTAIQTDLEDMFRKGVVFKKTSKDQIVWRGPAHLVQFHDASLVWPDATPAFYDLWRSYMKEEWPKLAPLIAQFMPKPFTRVIPIEKSLEIGNVQILSPENIRQVIEKADKIAVTNCTCRLSMRRCNAPLEVCLQINRGAEYTIERQSGRELSKEEALTIIEQTEKAGLVHVTMNKSDIGPFICNCCGCCCQSFSLLISDRIQLCDPSRYVPQINTSTCIGCGSCEDRCWFKAITLNADKIAEVNTNKCLGCGQCAIICPENAITMNEQKPLNFIPA